MPRSETESESARTRRRASTFARFFELAQFAAGASIGFLLCALRKAGPDFLCNIWVYLGFGGLPFWFALSDAFWFAQGACGRGGRVWLGCSRCSRCCGFVLHAL